MNIVLGSLYKIATLNKKNFCDIETFEHINGDIVKIKTFWRTCAFDIKIMSKNEALNLSKYLSSVSKGSTNLTEFSYCEFDESYDEYEKDITVRLKKNNDFKEKEIYEMTLENGVDWILKNGFDSVSVEYKLTLPLKII